MSKKFIKLLILNLIFIVSVNAQELDYAKIYEGLENPTFSYVHGIDPNQYYDMKNYAWSPYPLFRLNQEVYFKKQTIQPGYYLLTPREHEGKWYVLFKENGVVKATIPCYKDEIVSASFYNKNLPREKLTPSAKIQLKFNNLVGHISPSSGKKSSPKTFLEIDDVDNDFVSMAIYYGKKRYSILLRSRQ